MAAPRREAIDVELGDGVVGERVVDSVGGSEARDSVRGRTTPGGVAERPGQSDCGTRSGRFELDPRSAGSGFGSHGAHRSRCRVPHAAYPLLPVCQACPRRQSLEVPMAAMVRVQAVRGYRELVAELGGDPVRLLRAAKIKSAAFDQPASLISFEPSSQLLERSARDLACPDFGLRLAERQDIGILGPLAVAMRSFGHGGRGHALRLEVHLRLQRGHRLLGPSGQRRRPSALRLRDPCRTRSSLRPDDRARCRHHLPHREHALRRAESPEPGLVAASRGRLAGHLPSPPGCAGGVRGPAGGAGDRSARSRPASGRAQRGTACVWPSTT